MHCVVFYNFSGDFQGVGAIRVAGIRSARDQQLPLLSVDSLAAAV